MDIDSIQLESIAIVELLNEENLNDYSILEAQLIDKLRQKCMENVIFIGALRQLRTKFPAAYFSAELYLEGIT